VTADEQAKVASQDGWLVRTSRTRGIRLGLLALGLLVLVGMSFGLGKYPVNPLTVAEILVAKVLPLRHTWSPTAQTIVIEVRVPRVSGALLVGGVLAAAGGTYQNVFRNPLVSPDILGVSAGAAFGAALAFTLGSGQWEAERFAFLGGIVAAGTSFFIARVFAYRAGARRGGDRSVLFRTGLHSDLPGRSADDFARDRVLPAWWPEQRNQFPGRCGCGGGDSGWPGAVPVAGGR
jgi:ABC-type enterobactin transport system permease subunit